MPPKVLTFESELIDLETLTKNVKHFTFSVPDGFSYEPGQFVSLLINNPEGKRIRRPYSIASSPMEGKSIQLCLNLVSKGLASTFLFNLKKGDKVTFLGPMGKFVLKDTNKDLIFIATGTGIAPFRGMIYHVLKQGNSYNILLLKCVRYEDEILYAKFFSALLEEYPNFRVHDIVSRPKESYDGKKGYVQDLIEEHLPKDYEGDFYLCGLWAMIHSCKDLLIKKGIAKERIHFERYD